MENSQTVIPITPEQRARQYALEQRARREILASTRSNRGEVTRLAYNRLYREAPWHPDLRLTREMRLARLHRQETLLTRHIRSSKRVLEVGCGSGDLIISLAKNNPNVTFVGADISAEKLSSHEQQRPSNLSFLTADCVDPIDVGSNYDLVISSQVLEHFHPDDVLLHLRAVRQLIRPGGTFELDTPNSWTGPHDISMYFSKTASGTHLKEWTFRELQQSLNAAGFTRVTTDVPIFAHLRRILPIAGDAIVMPVAIKVALESMLRHVPRKRLRQVLFRAMRMDNIVVYSQNGRGK